MSSSSIRRPIAAAVIAACAAFAAQAEEFSWQLSGVTNRAETGDLSTDSWAVDGTYYLNPIDDSAGPYALAPFLNPTTRVSAAATEVESDPIDPATFTLSGAFVLPGEKWYIGADYAKASVDDTPYMTWSDENAYGVLAGRYLGPNTTLELHWGRAEQDSAFACPLGDPSCIGAPFESERSTDSVDLEVFHVRRFRSLTYSLHGSVSEWDTDIEVRTAAPIGPLLGGGDAQRVYSVATELFPTRRLGVRVGYSRPDGDYDVDSYDLAATWFFKPRVAVEFGWARSTLDATPLFESRHSENAAVRVIGRL